MAKPIQESIFKSRLTITYRTNISGTVQQESLPFRMLVLGEFSGRAMRADRLLPDLAEREVKSIKRATTVNDHLHELMPIWRIPKTAALKGLLSTLPGKVTFTEVTCAVPLGTIERNEGGSFPLSGKARFTSTMAENGLCDLEGELRVGGMLTATIAGGVVTAASADIIVSGALGAPYFEPASNKPAGIVSAFIETTVSAKTGLKLEPVDEDDAGPQPPKARRFTVKLDPAPIAAERTLTFQHMDAFSPDAITSSVPELRRLQVIKQLLADLQSGLRNQPELRKLLKTLLPAYGASPTDAQKKLAPFEALKTWGEESYPLLKVDRPAAKPDNGGAQA